MMKKMIYFGLGALTLTRERAEKVFSEMVEKGEMNRDEAKQWVEDVIKRGEEEKTEFRAAIRKEMEEIRSDFPLVTKADLEAIEARLAAIESKLQQQ
jgi:polyhydroxyalkanoate synthesis regulator phasin